MTGITLSTTKKTLLTIVQDACAELGLPIPQSIISNPDYIVVQMLALAKREGREFYKLQNHNGGWQALRKEHVFLTVAGQESYEFPDDFAYFINKTQFDRSFHWRLTGPLDPGEWQILKSGVAAQVGRKRFRVMNNKLYLHPIPGVGGDTEVFEYYSSSWVQGQDGTAKSTFTADSDYYLLDDDCMILGLKWRYKSAKGLDYTQEYDDYESARETEMAQDGGNRDLPLDLIASTFYLNDVAGVPFIEVSGGGATPTSSNTLLTENGDILITEDGQQILLGA